MGNIGKKIRDRREQRRVQYDGLREQDQRGRKRPGSMKKKGKGAAKNRKSR